MMPIMKIVTSLLLFIAIFEEINSLRLPKEQSNSDQNGFEDVLDISRSELSKILGRKQIRTNRKLVSHRVGPKLSSSNSEIPQPRHSNDASERSSPNDKVIETHKMVINFTDNTMKLVNNAAQIDVKVDQSQGTDYAIHQCQNSLLSAGALDRNIHTIRDICSVIYFVFCGINCENNRKLIRG